MHTFGPKRSSGVYQSYVAGGPKWGVLTTIPRMSACPTCGQSVPEGPDGSLGQLVFAERVREGMSLRQASAAWGIPFTTVHRVEKGEVPSAQHFATLVGILKLDHAQVADLFLDHPPRRRGER